MCFDMGQKTKGIYAPLNFTNRFERDIRTIQKLLCHSDLKMIYSSMVPSVTIKGVKSPLDFLSLAPMSQFAVIEKGLFCVDNWLI